MFDIYSIHALTRAQKPMAAVRENSSTPSDQSDLRMDVKTAWPKLQLAFFHEQPTSYSK